MLFKKNLVIFVLAAVLSTTTAIPVNISTREISANEDERVGRSLVVNKRRHGDSQERGRALSTRRHGDSQERGDSHTRRQRGARE
ncbi:hypothetical protein EV368DRAFT_81251 [Lentinula lateritia]|nr:hypothetical protein EV368DRAFT_81251 [Lentinula lateritia]